MLRTFRGLCLICFCILGIAVTLAVLEAAGCHSTEVLPSFTCGEGLARRSIEIILNLPLLFFYATAFALFGNMPPSIEFRLLLFLFDLILILALIYPLLFVLARKSGKPSS
jgi:hypothetical protein